MLLICCGQKLSTSQLSRSAFIIGRACVYYRVLTWLRQVGKVLSPISHHHPEGVYDDEEIGRVKVEKVIRYDDLIEQQHQDLLDNLEPTVIDYAELLKAEQKAIAELLGE